MCILRNVKFSWSPICLILLFPVPVVSYPRNHCQIQCNVAFAQCFLRVVTLTFRSWMHFEFIFVYGVRQGSNFMPLHEDIQFSQHYWLKRLSYDNFWKYRHLTAQETQNLGQWDPDIFNELHILNTIKMLSLKKLKKVLTKIWRNWTLMHY